MKTPQPKDTIDRKVGIPPAEASEVPPNTTAILSTSDKSRRIHPLKIAIIILSIALIILIGLIVYTSNINKNNIRELMKAF